MAGTDTLPTGTVTLMFTDIEGSTRLLAALGDGYVSALNIHRAIVRRAIAHGGGAEVDTQGDAFFAAFPEIDGAVAAAVAVHRDLQAIGSPVRVRIGVHTGQPVRNEDGYVGLDLHRGARICAAGHGGQVVLSDTSREQLTALPPGVQVRPLGAHLLKDLVLPMRLHDLVVEGLPSTFPPLRSLDAHPNNLPAQLGDLLGRATDLDAAADRVADGVRLLTLTGPGGTGKTTLAAHLAARLRTDFADGVYVVWLAPLATGANIADEIARTLGLRERAGTPVEDVLCDYLATRRMLLYLDNFEHVVDAAPLVARLLAAAPRVQILVTSRTPLRVPGETEMRIDPLSTGDVASGVASPAVQLFLTRARLVRPDFDPDESVRTVVAEICRRLDGLPLAIELAAARTRVLAPDAMLARLDRPLEVAGGGARHAEHRQQTLRATIAWSHGLLDDRLQRAFLRLGVFAGPFTLDAAEQVCDVGLDDLAELLDHSLLRSVDADAGRLGMLETVRAFARELLDASDDADAVRARHAAWAGELAAHGGPALLSPDHEHHLARFDAEHDELRTALDWLLRTGRIDAAVRLAADLAIFWETRGFWTEGRARLEAVLLASDASTPARDRARVLFSIGRLAFHQDDVARARTVLAEALPVFHRVGDARDVIVCQSHVAMAGRDSSDEEAAADEDVLRLARASGDPWSLGMALNNLADSLKTTQPDRARTLLAEALALRRRLGEKRTLAITLGNVGDVALILGDRAAAQAAYRECLTVALDVGYQVMMADARLGLADLALADGDLVEARTLASDAFEMAERLGDPATMARARSLLVDTDRRATAGDVSA